MLSQDYLTQAVLANKTLTSAEVKELKEKLKSEKLSLEEYLIKKRVVTEEVLYEMVAKHLSLPYIDLRNITIRKDILLAVPEPIAQAHEMIAFDRDQTSVKIATTDPDDLQTFEFLEKSLQAKLQIHLTSPSSFRDALKQYHQSLKAEFAKLTGAEEGKEEAKEGDLQQLAEDLPVVRIVDTLLEYAIFERASDIHIEPTETQVLVRYRVDGILKDVMTLPKNVRAGLVARIKILSNLKLDEHRLPQDGRFKIKTKEYEVSFRVSIIPVFDGEKIVMRLLQESGQVLTLEQLGLQKQPFEILKRNIAKPHGMILVTGPTGSGKTTTLYSVMNVLNTPDVNISTIEDPIEYRMPRINQSQVSPRIGFTFAGGLRALLRQDPDIIMVGEIRDTETAEIAIHAAMTGHLVLSTLHTNDAVGTLPRLLDMGVASFLVASTTNLIVAQRLVRKICQNCITSYQLSAKNVEDLAKQLDLPALIKTLTREGAISANQNMENLLFYRGKGCKQCGQEGYRGRLGIYEVFEITASVAELILNRASSAQLKKAALQQGMLTLQEDGFLKAKNGVTTVEEILRVTKD
ncbi:MAG: ATPase, T2SS/T4P/T4SS family [Candidatus Veblenbacteria bacterium]|nr:ATPase, T2SS/T4P/T4SS family [Candidatus Veblenbacteria bacterium]MDZ4229996.1 ATPase, T2SS/T4P/T4SS family [Candidatus Veblenbacteria bacterium]